MASLGYVKDLRRWRVRWHAKNRQTQRVFSGSKTFSAKDDAVAYHEEVKKQEQQWRENEESFVWMMIKADPKHAVIIKTVKLMGGLDLRGCKSVLGYAQRLHQTALMHRGKEPQPEPSIDDLAASVRILNGKEKPDKQKP